MKRTLMTVLLSLLFITLLTGCGFGTGCDTCGGLNYSFNYSPPSCCGTPW